MKITPTFRLAAKVCEPPEAIWVKLALVYTEMKTIVDDYLWEYSETGIPENCWAPSRWVPMLGENDEPFPPSSGDAARVTALLCATGAAHTSQSQEVTRQPVAGVRIKSGDAASRSRSQRL